MAKLYRAFICFDLGDTIMIEETENKDAHGVTVSADLIPGMADLIRDLDRRAILLGLVADTKIGTYRNVLMQHQLWEAFGVFSISDELGVVKPHPTMFEHARREAEALGAPTSQILMVGNNYARDVVGAKDAGFDACWFYWNERYPVPRDRSAADGTVASATALRQWIDDWLTHTMNTEESYV